MLRAESLLQFRIRIIANFKLSLPSSVSDQLTAIARHVAMMSRSSARSPGRVGRRFAPGIAREKYFEELADIRRTGRTLTDDEWADLFARHDQVNL